tara:strand:- start:4702 stop:5217 length:516 start_codon:yes stop_codon:yes gene_type:complete
MEYLYKHINIKFPQNQIVAKAKSLSIITKKSFYCDGSYSSKLNLAGIGVYSEHLDINISLGINNLFKKLSNNVAELFAIKSALLILHEKDLENASKYEVYSDSKYCVDSVNIFIKHWQKNGFKTKDGENVKNKELIVDIYNLTSTLKCSLIWIPREYNTIADLLAKKSVFG